MLWCKFASCLHHKTQARCGQAPFRLKANYAAMEMFPRPAMLNYVK